MGTRNLTCVIENGDFKVAQYCQWDGYLEGQGQDIVNFLTTHDLNIFREKLNKYTKLVSREEAWKYVPEKFKGKTSFDMAEHDELCSEVPHLVRDTGAKILGLIYNLDSEIRLADDHTFAADSLFCEWAYVINLDNNTLEVYEGFNKSPVSEDQRFAGIPIKEDSAYFQVRLIKVLPFEGLKKSYKNLIAEHNPDEDEE